MNRFKVFAVILCGFIMFNPDVLAQEPSPVKFYGIEHALIEYEISGSFLGKEVLKFDQWGMRQARFTDIETQKFGMANTVTINLNDKIVYIDTNKKLAQKKVNESLKNLLLVEDPNQAGFLSLQMVALAGGKKIKDENVLDRPCEVWEISAAKTKFWLWNGIILRSESQTPDGPVQYKAVNLDEAAVIDENVFVIPEGIEVLERDIDQILISRK